MIRFDAVVERLALAAFNRRPVLLVIARDGGFMGVTAVDGDRLGNPLAADGLREKASGGLGLPVLCEPTVKGLAGFVHDAIERAPLAFHPDRGLIHPPAAAHRARAAVERLCPLRTVLHDPALDRRVVDRHPALLQQFFHMPIAHGVGDIPAHAHAHDLLWDMGALEAHRHRHSPSLSTRSHREGSYPKLPPMKTCDRTAQKARARVNHGYYRQVYTALDDPQRAAITRVL